MSVYTGSCLCGSVTYEAKGEPRRVFNAIVTGVRRLLVALHVHMLCLIWAKSITLVVPYQNLRTRTLNTASK